MKHARPDYNRIQDPENKIPDDEPVFLLRANDRLASGIVFEYASQAERAGCVEIATAARKHAQNMQNYRIAHGGGKMPDM